MIDLQKGNVLFVAPHPDDIELGCSGLISSLPPEIMYYLVVSPALEDKKNKNILEEMKEATKVLGIKQKNVYVWDFPRRTISQQASAIRKKLVSFVNKISPKTIFCTCPNDFHQDHQFIGEEIARLFRDKNVLCYEVIHSSRLFLPNFYCVLSEHQLELKVEALQKYKSQLHRDYFDPSAIKGLARMRGAQIKVQYAEAFKARLIT